MTTRVVVVGAGSMGERHARVFASTAGGMLAGVYDVDGARAEALAARWGTCVLMTFEAAVERGDLVVLATPTDLHDAQARRVIERRRHVLVEKPLCREALRARELCAMAREAGVRLLVGHSERFNPVVRALVEATAEDPALAIQTVRRGTARPSREDVCLNLAVHDVDLAAVLFRADEAEERVRLLHASGGADRAELLVGVGMGVGVGGIERTARLEVSHGAQRMRSIHVQTARFDYEGDLLAPSLVRFPRSSSGAREPERVALAEGEPLHLQAEEALAASRGARPRGASVATGEEGARAVAVAEQALASMALERSSAAE